MSNCKRPPETCPNYEMGDDLLQRAAEMKAALQEIAAGDVDKGGSRRNHDGATAIARKVLRLDQR